MEYEHVWEADAGPISMFRWLAGAGGPVCPMYKLLRQRRQPEPGSILHAA